MKAFKLKTLLLLLMLILVLTFTACSNPKNEVVAIVNGEELMSDVLEDKLSKYIKAKEAQGFKFEGEEGQQQKDEIRLQFLNEMIDIALFKQVAAERGIEIGDTKVEENLNKMKETMGEEAFQTALEESFLTEDDIKELLYQQLLVEALFNDVTKEVQVEEQEIKDFYEENKKFLVTMQVSHILVKVGEEATDKEKQEAQEKAVALIEELNSGADFAELAKEHSDDTESAKLGGLIDYYFTEFDYNLDGDFVKGAYQLEVGEYSKEPVKTIFGYHIILANDKKDSYDELKNDIEQYLSYDAKNAFFDEFYNDIYSKAEIKNLLAGGTETGA